MIRGLLLLSAVLSICAQDSTAIRGEKVFQERCSVPYCHGPSGTAGRAPKLAGHSFTQRDLDTIVSNGIANKGMPAFGAQLPPEDIRAVVSFLMTLQGSMSGKTREADSPRAMPADVQRGKALFFDAVRMGGCGRCHELEKRGSPVGPDVKNTVGHSDLRAIEVRHVITAQPAGEPEFPALIAERSERYVRVFDLSSPLPVLRTFTPAGVKLKDGGKWDHRDAVSDYSDAELSQIEKYLQWAGAAK